MMGIFDLPKKEGRFVIEHDKIKDKIFYTNFNPDKERFNFYYLNDDGKRIYFKGNGRHSFDFPELLCAELANKVELDCIKPCPAVYIDEFGNQIEGIISEDYVKDREKTTVFNGNDFKHNYIPHNSVEGHYIGMILYADELSKKYGKQIEVDENALSILKSYGLFYLLTAQEDSFVYNFNYYLLDNVLHVDVMPDNSYSLLLNGGLSRFATDEFVKFEDISEHVFDRLKNLEVPFTIEYEPTKKREAAVSQYAKEIISDPELAKVYQKFCNLDFEKLTAKLKSDNLELKVEEIHTKQSKLVFNKLLKEMDAEIKNQLEKRLSKKTKTGETFDMA